ncbi:MAG TPA: hypothetical protein VHA75_02560 [Rugosimonospora sp.]|nr:hypothetical protein [Rugosimonospora sp.]
MKGDDDMMSRLYYVCCDYCGDPESEGWMTADEARTAARRRGWKRVGGKDYCRKHVEPANRTSTP